MLTTRQERVLEIIIREYVKNVTPVGSKLICNELNCSSATVRNEMSVLEKSWLFGEDTYFFWKNS